MPVFRRIRRLLVVLAFALGTVLPMARAGDVVCDQAAVGMAQPMQSDCGGDMAKATACAQAVCAGMVVVLPGGGTADAPMASNAFAAAPSQSGAGLSRLPEPHPPRLIVQA